MKAVILTLTTGLLLTLVSAYAYATTYKDLSTIARILDATKSIPKGKITMDILYDPNVPKSEEHAHATLEILNKHKIGKTTALSGKIINDPGQLSAKVVFVTKGSESHYKQALEYAEANKALTVSTDISCLSHGCVLVVNTHPKTDILVSSAAAAKTQTKFSSLFYMMLNKE